MRVSRHNEEMARSVLRVLQVAAAVFAASGACALAASSSTSSPLARMQALAAAVRRLDESQLATLRATHGSKARELLGRRAKAAAAPPIPGPPAGVNCNITELCDGDAQIGYFCRNVCAIGSVAIPDWHNVSLVTQRKLQFDTPLNRAILYGTHNSAMCV